MLLLRLLRNWLIIIQQTYKFLFKYKYKYTWFFLLLNYSGNYLCRRLLELFYLLFLLLLSKVIEWISKLILLLSLLLRRFKPKLIKVTKRIRFLLLLLTKSSKIIERILALWLCEIVFKIIESIILLLRGFINNS